MPVGRSPDLHAIQVGPVHTSGVLNAYRGRNDIEQAMMPGNGREARFVGQANLAVRPPADEAAERFVKFVGLPLKLAVLDLEYHAGCHAMPSSTDHSSSAW